MQVAGGAGRVGGAGARAGAMLGPMASRTPTSAAPERRTYADSGVSIEEGDRFVGLIQSMMRRTFGPRVIDNPGGFAGLFRLDYNEKLFKRNYKDPVLVACADGVGTKIKIATRLGRLDTIGVDLVAMNVNDLVVQGAEPLFFLDYIAAHKVEPERLAAVVKGVAQACEACSCALLGGETAEMPSVYPEGEIDLAGFAVGVVELKRATDPLRVSPGDIVLGLGSDGVHSNGFSLVNAIVDDAGLDLDRVFPELDASRTLGEVLLTPTHLYAPPIVRLLRAYTVKKVISGMAHITGGGLDGNLCRALPDDADALIESDAWEAPPVFGFLQKHGRVTDDEMRRVFNMGLGYCLIVRPAFADSVTDRLRRSGERVFRVGRIVKGKGRVRRK
jgi:phosphoribosylformylglycinamidine cyclo-ligase